MTIHKMKLQKPYFEKINSGDKTIEPRLCDKKKKVFTNQ